MTTQDLKDLLTYGFTIAKLADDVTKGFRWAEIGESLDVIKQSPTAIHEAKAALDEFLRLDDAGRAEITEFVHEKFQLEEQNVETAIKTVLDVVLAVTALNTLFIKKA